MVVFGLISKNYVERGVLFPLCLFSTPVEVAGNPI